MQASQGLRVERQSWLGHTRVWVGYGTRTGSLDLSSKGQYLGMQVRISELDHENQDFYGFCAKGELRFQKCSNCQLKRYPPTTACPWCSALNCSWEAVDGRGTLYSYGEIHHAITPAFREFSPYLLLLVELDEQRNMPNAHDGLRMYGNLVTADGTMASPQLVKSVGIGTRLRVLFKPIGDGIALPLWTIDDEAVQPDSPWRYPHE
jgi:uncharacterized OB-fold protein